VIGEVNIGAVHVVGEEGATGAALAQIPSPHEMIDDQLAAAVEELGERPFALGRIENVLLLDLHPRQRASLGSNEIAHAGECLLALEMRLACGKPLVSRHDAGVAWFGLGSTSYASTLDLTAPPRAIGLERVIAPSPVTPDAVCSSFSLSPFSLSPRPPR
jgi:hypothetical protein